MAQPTLLNPNVRISINEVVGGAFDGEKIVSLTFSGEKLCAVLVAAGVITQDGVIANTDIPISLSWNTATAIDLAEKIRTVADA